MRVQKLRNTGVAMVILALVSFGVLAAGVATAGAQQTTPDTPCLYTVSPTTLGPGGGNVTVAGSAPGSSVINVYVDGVFRTSVVTDTVTGAFSVTIFIGQTSRVAITIDDYPATGCGIDPANQTSSRGAGAGAGSLPRTGSNNVKATVLVALALVLVGAVLVVAVRRHEHVRGRQ